MLARIDKKDLAERAKSMRAVAQAPQNLLLKAPAIIVPTFTEDNEETFSRPIFKRRRKTTAAPTEHSESDGCAPSNHAPPPSPTPPRDMIVVREDKGTSFQEEGIWDQGLDVPSFLEKALLPNKAKENLIRLEEDRVV